MRVAALALLMLPMVNTTEEVVVDLFAPKETPLYAPRKRPLLENDDVDAIR